MGPRIQLLRSPLLAPAGCLAVGGVLAGQITVPLEALAWVLAWLLWPAAAAVVLDHRPGHPVGILLAVAGLAPAWTVLTSGGTVSATQAVTMLMLSPPVLAVGVLFPWGIHRAVHDDIVRRRLLLAAWAALGAALGVVTAAAVSDRLTAAGLYVATGLAAAAPFGLAWLAVTDALPAVDLALARSALALAALASLAVVYVAAVAVLAVTNLPDQEVAGAVLVAVAAIGLMPAWTAARRRLLIRLYGSGRAPGLAQLDLAHRLRQPTDPDSLLQEVADSVARSLRSPAAEVRLGLSNDPQPSRLSPDGEPSRHPGADSFTARVPLGIGSREVGTLVVAPRRTGERFTRADLRLLDNLAPQIALLAEAVLVGRQLAAAERRTLRLREEERERIRADLHDVLGPLLAGLGMHVAAAYSAGAAGPDVPARLHQVAAGIEQCRTEVRRLAHDLRPAAHRAGLSLALRALVDDWARAAAGEGPRFESAVAETSGSPAQTDTAMQLVAGEAVTNVVRHAKATWCRVSLRADSGQLILSVEDDGQGMRDETPGVGLTSMRRRIEQIGGRLTIADRRPRGTVVTARVPTGMG